MDALMFRLWQHALRMTLEVQERAAQEDGQTLAEYSLILTVIAVGVVVPTMILFRGALAGAFTTATDCMNQVTC